MRIKNKQVKKALNWEEFKNSLSRAGFQAKPEHPEWMLLNTKGENTIIAIPGSDQQKPLPGAYVYEEEIHVVWFATRKPIGSSKGNSYEISIMFPASVLS